MQRQERKESVKIHFEPMTELPRIVHMHFSDPNILGIIVGEKEVPHMLLGANILYEATFIENVLKTKYDTYHEEIAQREPPFLTRREVGEYLRINMNKLHECMEEGKIKWFKVGRKSLFEKRHVDQFVSDLLAEGSDQQTG